MLQACHQSRTEGNFCIKVLAIWTGGSWRTGGRLLSLIAWSRLKLLTVYNGTTSGLTAMYMQYLMKLPGGPTVRQRSDRQTITLISGRTADYENSANSERSKGVRMKVKLLLQKYFITMCRFRVGLNIIDVFVRQFSIRFDSESIRFLEFKRGFDSVLKNFDSDRRCDKISFGIMSTIFQVLHTLSMSSLHPCCVCLAQQLDFWIILLLRIMTQM